MKTNLNYKLTVNTEPELKGLYDWCINEVRDNGNVVSGDLIPAFHYVNFDATHLKYYCDNEMLDEEHRKDKNNKYEQIESMRGGLKVREEKVYHQPSFQMFGTDREITDFSFSIYPNSTREYVFINGVPEATYKFDFREETMTDSLHITMEINEDRFKKLAELLTSKSITDFYIHLKGVDGFYTNWSPEGTTPLIKVLTEVHIEEGWIDIPKEMNESIKILGQNIEDIEFGYGSSQDFDSDI